MSNDYKKIKKKIDIPLDMGNIDEESVQKGIEVYQKVNAEKGTNGRDGERQPTRYFDGDWPAPVMELYAGPVNATILDGENAGIVKKLILERYYVPFQSDDEGYKNSNDENGEGTYYYYDDGAWKKYPKFLIYWDDENDEYVPFFDTKEEVRDTNGKNFKRSDGFWRGITGKIRHYYIAEENVKKRGANRNDRSDERERGRKGETWRGSEYNGSGWETARSSGNGWETARSGNGWGNR